MRHFCVGGWPDNTTESVSIWWYKMLFTSLSQVILQIAVLIKTKSKSSIGQPCHALAAALSSWEPLWSQNRIENENKRASLEERRDSRGQNAQKRGGRRTSSSLRAYMDTLVLLSNLKSALKQNQLMCETLEEKLTKRLAETEESHQEEWREEGFRRELLEQVGKFRLCLKSVRDGKKDHSREIQRRKSYRRCCWGKKRFGTVRRQKGKKKIQCLT